MVERYRTATLLPYRHIGTLSIEDSDAIQFSLFLVERSDILCVNILSSLSTSLTLSSTMRFSVSLPIENWSASKCSITSFLLLSLVMLSSLGFSTAFEVVDNLKQVHIVSVHAQSVRHLTKIYA